MADAGIELVARISNANDISGVTNGSQEITFTPGPLSLPNHFTADAVTAGSVMLLLQISLPLLLFSNNSGTSSLTLKGGTNADQAPQVDYTQYVFLRFFERFFPGPEIRLQTKKRGYFPKGGGEIFVEVKPTTGKLPPITLLERGRVLRIGGVAHFGGLPYEVGKRMAKAARTALVQAGFSSSDGVDVRIGIEPCDTKGPGSGIVLWAELEGGGIIGGSAVGKKGVDSGKTGEEASEQLLKALDTGGGCVDEWLQDQIIILMALADGKSSIDCGKNSLTLHTRCVKAS
jgi:RNA 3'-terminal phosphate cyclase (ATP)